MELKEWELYTKEEKKALLNHWWYYYGKELYTLTELEEFNKLIDERADDILVLAIFSALRGQSSQILLHAIREGVVNEVFDVLPETNTKDELYNREYKMIRSYFLKAIVTSYNNPKPAVPMSDEEIIDQIQKL